MRAAWCVRASGVAVGALLCLMGCSNKPQSGGGAPPRDTAQPIPPPAPPAEVLRLYEEAASLDPLNLMQLASQEGLGGLVQEAAREAAHRPIALAALPYTRRLAAVEYLGSVIETTETHRALALQSLGELIARVNRNEDAEDFLELQRGCDALTRFVAAGKGKAEDRARAESYLQLLGDYGCSAPAPAAP